MTRDRMLAELREVMDDVVQPYKWSNIRLLGFLSEGQDKFCEDTGYFVDFTTYKITLSPGVKTYPLSDRIYEVFEVWDGPRKLTHFSQANRNNTAETPVFIYEQQSPGGTLYWQTDQQTGTLSIEPAPSDAGELQLMVWRYATVALEDSGAQPQIPARFHRACIEWAAHKGYSNHDADAGDPKKAADHEAAYNDYTKDGKRAWRAAMHVHTSSQANPTYNLGCS